MNSFETDSMDEVGSGPSSEMLAVLLEGTIPHQFASPPKAIASSDRTSLTAVMSSLDRRGVDYLRDLVSAPQPPDVRLVLLVHATCPTQERISSTCYGSSK
jgi:hypothetical protein